MKKDITYTISGNEEILCINEIHGEQVKHHSNGVYFLMDEPDNEEVKSMTFFGQTRECFDLVESMEKGEKRQIEFNGYNFEVMVREIHEGGLFKSS